MKVQLAMAAAVAVLLPAWLAAAAAGGGRSEGLFDPPPVVISITNNLEGREILGVHCKDKKWDIGSQWVPYGQAYKFQFPSAEYSTDFFCGFTFNGVLHWFDIYLGKRDMTTCNTHCLWNVTDAGPCRLTPTVVPVRCFPWNHDDADAALRP